MFTKFICLIVLSFLQLTVIFDMQTNNYSLTTTTLDDEAKNSIIENLDISLFYEQPSQVGISCFDVNQDGEIALGHNGIGESKSISVYDSNGEFEYGYKFQYYSSFLVLWANGRLNIYLVRSEVLVTVDGANVIDIVSVPDTIENNQYIRNQLWSTKKVIGETTYELKNDMGILNYIATSYSQVVRTMPNGEESILYSINDAQVLNTWLNVLGIIAFVVLAVCVLIKTQSKSK